MNKNTKYKSLCDLLIVWYPNGEYKNILSNCKFNGEGYIIIQKGDWQIKDYLRVRSICTCISTFPPEHNIK
jgi:hypothetical protein